MVKDIDEMRNLLKTGTIDAILANYNTTELIRINVFERSEKRLVLLYELHERLGTEKRRVDDLLVKMFSDKSTRDWANQQEKKTEWRRFLEWTIDSDTCQRHDPYPCIRCMERWDRFDMLRLVFEMIERGMRLVGEKFRYLHTAKIRYINASGKPYTLREVSVVRKYPLPKRESKCIAGASCEAPRPERNFMRGPCKAINRERLHATKGRMPIQNVTRMLF